MRPPEKNTAVSVKQVVHQDYSTFQKLDNVLLGVSVAGKPLLQSWGFRYRLPD